MAERLSTGLVNALLDTGSLRATMADGVLDVYSGTQPATADAVETGTKLLSITLASGAFTGGVATNGLEMEASATSGVLEKSASEVWSGDGIAAGTAGWFRWYDNDYTTGASTTAVRADGSVGTSSAFEMQMSNLSITIGGETIINSFSYTIPMS